jgi:hypothetical protein
LGFPQEAQFIFPALRGWLFVEVPHLRCPTGTGREDGNHCHARVFNPPPPIVYFCLRIYTLYIFVYDFIHCIFLGG